jgi:WD40 repeat protein
LDGTISLWDASSGGRLLTTTELNGIFQVGSSGERIAFWDAESGDISLYEMAFPEFVRTFDFAAEHRFGPADKFFSADDSLLLMSSGNRTAWVLNTRTGKKLGRVQGPADFYCYLDNSGKWFATESGVGVHAWPVSLKPAQRELVIGPPRKVGDTDIADWVRFSEDQSTLVYVEDKIVLRAVRVSDFSYKAQPLILKSFPGNLATSRKGDAVAVSDPATGFSLYNLIGDEFESAVPGLGRNTFRTFAFHPNDKQIILNGPNKISISDLEPFRETFSVSKEQAEFPGKVTVAENGQFVAVQSRAGINVLSLSALRPLFEIAHVGPAEPKISPSGKYLALHWENSRLELWNLELLWQKLNEMGLAWPKPVFGKVRLLFEVEPEKITVVGALPDAEL